MNEVDSADGEAVCYLCLDGGVDDEDGLPLQRDCACRGSDAGFVHLSCLTKYAETKCQQTCDVDEFRDPWLNCPH
jgi:E3 ubiquitin-protein ligase DOA10